MSSCLLVFLSRPRASERRRSTCLEAAKKLLSRQHGCQTTISDGANYSKPAYPRTFLLLTGREFLGGPRPQTRERERYLQSVNENIGTQRACLREEGDGYSPNGCLPHSSRPISSLQSRTCSPQSPELRIERLTAERTFWAPNRIGGLIGNTTYRLNYLRDCWREEGGN